MALLHEHLHPDENSIDVSVDCYLKSMIQHVVSSHGRPGVEVERSISQCVMNLETVLPCGLLLNELLTNVFKHAFPDNRHGHVRIDFAMELATGGGGRNWRLAVEDDGVGCAEAALNKENTLGWKIIRMLCSQLKAEMSCATGNGFRFFMRFKELLYTPRM